MGAAAQHMQGYGRNGDTMLMHVSPEEVGGLQALAHANGTTLTINPHTGMPEAFSLKKLLPTLLGIAGSFLFPGLSPFLIPGLVGVGKVATGGSLKEGLMAGLQAYGGASIGTALKAGIGKVASSAATKAISSATPVNAVTAGVTPAAGVAANVPITTMAQQVAAAGGAPTLASTAAAEASAQAAAKAGIAQAAAPQSFNLALPMGNTAVSQAAAAGLPAAGTAGTVGANYTMPLAETAAEGARKGIMGAIPKPVAQFARDFSDAAQMGLPAGTPTILTKSLPGLAASGVASGVMGAMTPTMEEDDGSGGSKYKWDYEGPYEPTYREVSYPGSGMGSAEHLYFNPTNPVPGYVPIRNRKKVSDYGGLIGYADGGEVSSYREPIYFSRPKVTTEMPEMLRDYAATLPASALPTYRAGNVSTRPPVPGFVSTADRMKANPTKPGAPVVMIRNTGNMSTRPPVPGYKPTNPNMNGAPPGMVAYPGGIRYAGDYNNYGEYAAGGMTLEDGAFIVDARTVSELGNGSSSAGQDRLRRLGGQPIKGKGDGVSDSVKANIGGRQDARVARDEVKFSPQAVAKLGGGDKKRGADKLYSLMAKAEKARKTAKRGQDTGLASLLGA
jgi:hypothetical protein